MDGSANTTCVRIVKKKLQSTKQCELQAKAPEIFWFRQYSTGTTLTILRKRCFGLNSLNYYITITFSSIVGRWGQTDSLLVWLPSFPFRYKTLQRLPTRHSWSVSPRFATFSLVPVFPFVHRSIQRSNTLSKKNLLTCTRLQMKEKKQNPFHFHTQGKQLQMDGSPHNVTGWNRRVLSSGQTMIPYVWYRAEW